MHLVAQADVYNSIAVNRCTAELFEYKWWNSFERLQDPTMRFCHSIIRSLVIVLFGFQCFGLAHAESQWTYSTVLSEDGVPLVVAEAGQKGAIPILFLHGYSQSLASWKYQLNDAALGSKFHLIAYDMRGHGASGKPWAFDAYESRDWASDVAAVIEAKDLEQPILVGWSGGASVIAAYIRHYGQSDIAGLVLAGGLLSLSPPADPPAEAAPPTERQRAVQSSIANMASDDIAKKLKGTETLVSMVTSTPMSERDYMVTVAFTLMQPAYVSDAMVANSTTYEDLSGKITVPTMLIHGTADALIPFEQSVANQALIPGSALKAYEGAGHAMFLEEPDAFNRDITEFALRVYNEGKQ